MNISVLDDFTKASFSRENDKLYCVKDDQMYQLISYGMLSDIVIGCHQDLTSRRNQYIVTTDEHYKVIDIKYSKANKSQVLDNQFRTRSEERVLSVLSDAIQRKSSDVHFIREEETASIKFRVNGKVEKYQEVVSSECDEMLFVLYNVMASTKETTWNTKTSQDANVLIDIGYGSYRFRYSHMPIFANGVGPSSYHAVVRVIYGNEQTAVCSTLSMLDLMQEEEIIIDTILSNPSGLVVVSGVTGSGKSTSLKNYMEYIYHEKYQQKGCFISVEDPVEYIIEGAQQSSVVKSKEGENLFSDAVRSAMRRDPDVLMIGEIRDIQTGQALASAVESGHLCLTTVHAGNVIGVFQRLIGLGIDLDKLVTPGFVVGVMNQKLIPVLCPHCAETQVNEFNRSVKVQGKGCSHCDHHCIIDRKMVMEQLVPDLQMLRYISENNWVDTYTYYRSLRSTNKFGQGYLIKDKIYNLCLEGTVCYQYFKSAYGLMEPEDESLVFQVHQSKK